MNMNIVITGSTKGIGLALAKEFLRYGDNVVISSRNRELVEQRVEELKEKFPKNEIYGTKCDVTIVEDIEELASYAKENLKIIDFWINNAGTNGGEYKELTEVSDNTLKTVLTTNLLGTLRGTKIALNLMKPQGNGHIFNMAGWGAGGRPSPKLVVYGASKAPVPQLTKSLVKETKKYNVGIHYLNPGMVVTEFLAQHVNKESAKIFNILAEKPEEPVRYLVKKMRKIKGTGKSLSYSSSLQIFWKFMTASKRKNRFFDEEGTPLIDIQ